MLMRPFIALLATLLTAGAQAASCVARSGPQTAVLVELYTSEGCNSCPPADRWLSGLAEKYPADRVVPLALHVDYWDYIGWKDPYAKREFSQRQRRLSQLQRASFVYTPQVLVQGVDFPAWHGVDFERAVREITARPARASLELETLGMTDQALRLRALALVPDAKQAADAVLYVAAYENRLQSRVTAGENEGRVLQHDRVVLEWQGPYGLGVRQLALKLLPKPNKAESGVAAFIQNQRTGEVLQALALAPCAP